MTKNVIKHQFNLKSRKTIFIGTILILMLLLGTELYTIPIAIKGTNSEPELFDKNESYPEISNGETPLFQGTEAPLTVNDSGILYELNQEISILNQEEETLSYYLDDTNNWEVGKIETSIKDLQDTRNWVNNSEFEHVQVFRKYQTYESAHLYDNVRTAYNNPEHTIVVSGAIYMRVHFVNMSFDYQTDASNSDFMVVYNGSDSEVFAASGFREDFYSPWSIGEEIQLSYEATNLGNRDYGYYIDYYEFVNASSNFELNSDNWQGRYAQSGTWGSNYYGFGNISDVDAMFIGYHGSYWDDLESFVFYDNTYTECYQENIIIPRGRVVDAYLSFDYYAQYALDTNNIIMYMSINGEKVYSKGLLDIDSEGKNQWHQTNKVPMYLWTNKTEIFTFEDLSDQSINVSIGIRNVGDATIYSGYEDGNANLIWFDNIKLVITSFANATQEGIDLTLDDLNFELNNEWGSAKLNLTTGWDTNPVTLTLNTTSPELTFKLNATLYSYHEAVSSYNQLYDQGVSYEILENGSIFLELYHYLYMPPFYEDFEFIIEKPKNWEFISVLDPFLQSRQFNSGKSGDTIIHIDKNNALFAGWYTLRAISPNYLNLSNNNILKNGQWVQNATFGSDEFTQITAQLDYMDEIPVDTDNINLSIYYPNGTLFYSESKAPVNGNVTFSKIFFGSYNTSGGIYSYTLFWSNGTALGGLKSNFVVNHESFITLLKPDDAKSDYRTEGFVGDIIPVRILLKDFENNNTISDSIVSYNWTDGIRYFTESALGIYESVLDTADLLSRGLYNIIISSSKVGFFTSNITLEINLGEETNLQVLESEYNIELHANSTIRFKFSDFDGDGIDEALVTIDISNSSLYSITNPEVGIYNIEFSTLFIDDIGIYQLSINFSAAAYEPQNYIYQFQIIQQSVNLSTYIDSQEINENSLVETTFNSYINISAKAISNIDREFLSGGVVTFVRGNYEKNLTGYGDYWYNSSIFCSADNFSLGINLVYLRFEHPNYRTATFGFQILVNQIEITVDPLSFEDSITADIGQTINIQISLMDPVTYDYIENASISYTWDYGIGTINETTPGTYQTFIKLPDGLEGNFRFNLIITPDKSIYKTTQYSFIVIIGEPSPGPQQPNYLLWIIIGILISVVSVLGILSLRSYVILPRKRKKEAALLSKTQRFRDLKNIQAIVVIHKLSGIPIFSKSYSILEKHKKELFSGFIQAITMIGEEFAEKEIRKPEKIQPEEGYGIQKMIELNFKQFYCLIADIEDIRVVVILKEKSSERLKSQISNLILALNLKLSKELENWDGSLDDFEILVPEILNEYFELYYKDSFKLAPKINLIALKKEKKLSKMESRVINVIQSMSSDNIVADLNNIVELVSEENKSLIIEAIESLIEQKIIIPLEN
ncbi:MAG: hypothetical protein ACFFA0_01040 [Promethearchaeota archaeon]